MTREDTIQMLQDQVYHGWLTSDALADICNEKKILLHEEVLEPIGYNTCDRCGEYGNSEQDFLWVDSYEWDEDNNGDQAIIKAMQIEGVDYCALCWGCVSELKKKGVKHVV